LEPSQYSTKDGTIPPLPMICNYCPAELRSIYKETDKQTVFNDLLCGVCNVHYVYVIDAMEEPYLSDLAFFNIMINDREFEVQFHYGTNKTVVKHIAEVKELTPTKQMTTVYRKEVFSLNFIPPKWTPFNVKEKLELLLPFV
jgi:hypothetical protein